MLEAVGCEEPCQDIPSFLGHLEGALQGCWREDIFQQPRTGLGLAPSCRGWRSICPSHAGSSGFIPHPFIPHPKKCRCCGAGGSAPRTSLTWWHCLSGGTVSAPAIPPAPKQPQTLPISSILPQRAAGEIRQGSITSGSPCSRAKTH